MPRRRYLIHVPLDVAAGSNLQDAKLRSCDLCDGVVEEERMKKKQKRRGR